jgi:hypothetical protein
MLLGSTWPIALLALVAVIYVLKELIRDHAHRDAMLVAPRSMGSVVRAGLERTLPLTLIVTFLMVPSTAMRIFKTFLLLPGFEPWLLDSHPLHPTTGVPIPVRQVRSDRV